MSSPAPTKSNFSGLRDFAKRLGAGLQAFLEAGATYYAELAHQAETFRRLIPLGPLGWTISTYGMQLAPVQHHEASVELDLDVASAHLEQIWATPAVREMICALVRYAYPVEARVIADRRRELLLRASNHYDNGLYAEAVLLAYSQIDGMFADRADESGAREFGHVFKKRKPKDDVRQFTDIVADARTMISTEPEFFLAVRTAISANVDETTLADHPSRHGVLHGRVLGYDTSLRAAQAFAFLAGCVELLITTRPEVPLTSEEEDAPIDQAPPDLRFALMARRHLPVRSVYIHSSAAQNQQMLAAWNVPSR